MSDSISILSGTSAGYKKFTCFFHLRRSIIRKKKGGGMSALDKYICVVCNYIYNPEEGDPAHGIPAGTPWEQVPEDWVCPWCQLGKEYFEKHDR